MSSAESPDLAIRNGVPGWMRVISLLALLFLFLVAIDLLSGSFKLLGKDAAATLFHGVSNPFAGLAVGVLATVLVQSSSVTTATIVGLVGAPDNPLPVDLAVPMIMGANIGTTVTNTLVSIGHVRRGAEFKRAFAAATVHDFFNVIAVAILLPLEILTGFLSKAATSITSQIPIGAADGSFKSPIKQSVKSVSGVVKDFITETLGFVGVGGAVCFIVLAIFLIFFCLRYITGNMKKLIAARAERALNVTLQKSGLIAIVIGALLTVAVQSSSITTSLLVPMCGSGVLTLENAFPVMLGANLGTTVTAFLASLATDINGLTIAMVHFLFNLSGVLLVFPLKATRQVPLTLARGLALRATRNVLWVIGYVLGVFVIIPLLGILLFR